MTLAVMIRWSEMRPASSTATFVTSVDEVDAKMSRRLLSRVGELTNCISPSESSMSASPTSTDDGAGPGQFTSPHTTRLSVQLAMSDAMTSLSSSTNSGTVAWIRRFVSDSGKTINGLMVSKDSDGLCRVKTKLLYHDDSDKFCSPMSLPQKHPLVVLLIRWYHLKLHHAGTPFLISKLRERFWICQARRAINRVIHKCPTCLRHSNKSFQTDPAVLPTMVIRCRLTEQQQ